MLNTVEWPSGLRRQVKALISSEARVRIPSQPAIPVKPIHFIRLTLKARLAQMVERMTLNHVVVGSIPTSGV